jgi:hypothetical protein
MVYAITSDKTQVDEDTVREVLNDNIFIETFDPAEAAE